MTADNFESIIALAADSYTQEQTFTGNGKEFTCTINTAIQTSVIAEYQNLLAGREKALKAHKQLDVKVPIAVIQGREDLFPGWKPAGDAFAEFPVKKQEEILVATTIETFVLNPKFTWAEAAVFGRINGAIALKIQAKVMKWLADEGVVEAKND